MRTRFSRQYRRDIERLKRRNKDMQKLATMHEVIVTQDFEVRHKNHKLKGKYTGLWECHVEGDWVVIYDLGEDEIYLVRTGSHSDVFGRNY